jgi:ankyrin repeat protein
VGTALDWACEFGRNQLCEKFLKIEGFKNQRETDKIGLVRRASQLGNKDLVTLFVDTWDWNTIDDEGNTAVHIACLAGYADVVTVLLGKIGVVQMVKQQQNKKRKTVLDIARLKADPEILSVLSKYGVYS